MREIFEFGVRVISFRIAIIIIIIISSNKSLASWTKSRSIYQILPIHWLWRITCRECTHSKFFKCLTMRYTSRIRDPILNTCECNVKLINNLVRREGNFERRSSLQMWNRILCLENRRRHDRYIGCVNYAILQRAKHVVRPDNLSGRLNNIGGNSLAIMITSHSFPIPS